MTADCLACSAGVSVDKYCRKHPKTVGCPPRMCCKAMTADCLACAQGITTEEYCDANPQVPGCFQAKILPAALEVGRAESLGKPPKFCCMGMTADCLACSAGVSVDKYCRKHPKTVGCPPRMCCKAMTAGCLACAQGITTEEYCDANP